MIKTSFRKNEIIEIINGVNSAKKAIGKIPMAELKAIIRTTPLIKLNRRLRGVLQQ